MKMHEIMFALLLAIIIAAGGLWLLGRNQPVITVTRNAGNTTTLQCQKCSGLGYAESQQKCPKCGGSGKVEPFSKSGSSKSLGGAKLMCVNCRGTGKAPARLSCEACDGKGSMKSSAQTTTVRADFSLWERCLAFLRIKPDLNCAPQLLGGKYPLIEQYLLLPGKQQKISIDSYAGVEKAGDKWHVNAIVHNSGNDALQPVIFVVHNREVIGSVPGR